MSVTMSDPVPPKMRSWHFAPGDSVKKMARAAAGPADIVLLDLEDAVTPENKLPARPGRIMLPKAGAGAIGHKGGMLDRTYPSRAQSSLALASEQ